MFDIRINPAASSVERIEVGVDRNTTIEILFNCSLDEAMELSDKLAQAVQDWDLTHRTAREAERFSGRHVEPRVIETADRVAREHDIDPRDAMEPHSVLDHEEGSLGV